MVDFVTECGIVLVQIIAKLERDINAPVTGLDGDRKSEKDIF